MHDALENSSHENVRISSDVSIAQRAEPNLAHTPKEWLSTSASERQMQEPAKAYLMIAKALSQNLTVYARENPTIMVNSSASDKRRHSNAPGGVRRRELPLVRQTDARQRESSTITAAMAKDETEKRTPRTT